MSRGRGTDGGLRPGKLPGTALRRSVLGELGVASDRRRAPGGSERTVYAPVCAAPGFERSPGVLVAAAANRLAALGAEPESLILQAFLPCGYTEEELKRDMREIASQAASRGMKVIGGHTQVSVAVLLAQYAVTAIGRTETEAQAVLRPGQELVLTKWIALAGTAAAASAHEAELEERFPRSLVETAKGFARLISVEEEARAASLLRGCAMQDLSQGGIFGALWEMAERADVGLDVELRRIPIRQETVEICEYFDMNPYSLYSAGALLIGTWQGETLVRALAGRGIPAAVIGRATDGRARIVRNGEDTRYLDRPGQDEWYRRFEAI